MFQILILIAVTLSNYWIWRIFNNNIFLFCLLIICSLFLYKVTISKVSQKWLLLTLIFFSILFIFQWKTTEQQSLTLLSNSEQRIKQLRISSYNPGSHYLRLLFLKFNLINFLEGDFNTLANRIQRNFFESVDPNVYFFAGHPRERIEVLDFEKFHFLLIFPFLIGFYKIITVKKFLIIGYLSLSIVLLSLIGLKNNFGPFVLFPALVVIIYQGITIFKKYVT